MAKVYDALRRAEEERRRLSDEAAPTVARLEWEPEATSQESAVVRRQPWFRRLWTVGRRRAELAQAGELNKRRVSLLQPDSYVAEQFRALRGRIDALERPDRPLRTISLVSAQPGEGKTTASINLALVTALSLGRRVLLVDCDLRRPNVHRSFGLQPRRGLSEVLTGEATLDEAITQVEGANLDVLCVRDRPVNPSELLTSEAMKKLIVDAAQRYDRVFLDTPAALGLPDAKAICDQSDGMVIIVRADQTRQEDVQTVLEFLDRDRILGMVLNGTVSDQGRYGYAS